MGKVTGFKEFERQDEKYTSVKDRVKHYKEFSDANLITLAVGFVVSFFVAYLTIKLFLKFLENFTFVAFGIYRIIFGIILLTIFN